jgi:thiol:disulfide interchange protein DsbC
MVLFPHPPENPMPRILSLLVFLAFAVLPPAFAQEKKDESAVRASVEKILNTKVESVKKTDYPGLYEVFANGQILYVDEKVSMILIGDLIDTKTMQSVTEARLGKLSAIKFANLPLAQAIKQVRGDGKRILATFEDPNCGYCKRLARDLIKLDNITLYTFLAPILSKDSDYKSRQIWCARDRAKSWNDWMAHDKVPGGKGDCNTSAIDANVDLARKLNIQGTPTLFFADGERIAGAVPIAQIEQKMNQLVK